MKAAFFIGLLLSFFSLSAQQAAQPYWQRAVGGYGNEWANGFTKTFDKGYAFVSSNYQSLGGDIDDQNISYDSYVWLVKLDSNRNIAWQKKLYDGTFPQMGYSPEGLDIIQTKDSGIIVLGRAGGIWAIKYDKDGNYQWIYEDPTDTKAMYFYRLLENEDGSVMLCGDQQGGSYYARDGVLICLNPNGQLKWKKVFSGGSTTFLTITKSHDGNFLVGGYSNPGGNKDFYVAKISYAGDMIWSKILGGNGNEMVTAILALPDQTYMIGGVTNTDNNGDVGIVHCFGGTCQDDGWFVKLSETGNVIAKQIWGDFLTEKVSDMVLYKNGILVLGSSNSDLNGFKGTMGGFDMWGMQIDYNLNLVEQHFFYGGPKDDEGKRVLIDSADGQIFPVIFGNTASESGGQVEGFHDDPGVLNETDIWLFKTNFFNTIKGYAFYDYNKNGSKEPNEPFYKRGVFTASGPSDTLTSYNNTGTFLFKPLKNNYITKLTTNDTVFNIVPVSKTSAFTNYFNTDSIRFAMQLKPGFSDISVAAYALKVARPGFETIYEALLANKSGDTVYNKQLFLLKDPRLIYKRATPAPSRITADSIIWQYSNLKPTDSVRYSVWFTVSAPPATQINDTLHSYFQAPLSTDIDTTTNIATINQIVRGAYDPNLKEETHSGKLAASKAIKGEFLTYTILFQNTGTDTAFNVIVRDTLDYNLSPGSLEILKTSHPCSFSIKNRILQWSFTNIQLPDSNINEPASHGFIIYRIKANSNIVPGSYVYNRASIYFDFNTPVITNKASTYIWSDIITNPGNTAARTQLVSIYPNPVHGSVWLGYKGTSPDRATIIVYDIMGRQVAYIPDQQLSSAPVQLPVSFLHSGMYYFKIAGKTTNETHTIVVAE